MLDLFLGWAVDLYNLLGYEGQPGNQNNGGNNGGNTGYEGQPGNQSNGHH